MKNLKKQIYQWISGLTAMILLTGMMAGTAVSAQDFQPEVPLEEYATEVVGTTDQGWKILSSVKEEKGPVQDRAVGSSGMKVSKSYNGIRSYTEILTVISNSGKTSIAYCVQPELNTPNNTDYHQQILNNDRLRTVLYYGYGGVDSAEFMAMEGGNVNNAYMDTWMAARQAYNGTASPASLSDPMVQWLLNHPSAPAERFSVGGSPQTAQWNPDAMRQETGWFTTAGGGTFTLNLDGTGVKAELSDGRILDRTTSGIATGTSFRLLADAACEKNIQMEIPTTAKGYAGMIFVPTVDKERQAIVSGHGGDPLLPGRIQAVFERKEEKSRVVKRDLETGDQSQGDALLDGAVFGLFTESGEKRAEGTVKNGCVEFPAQICGRYYIQEIKPGEGYLLNEQKYPILLNKPGEMEITEAENQVKKGKIKLKKLAIPSEEQQEQGDGGGLNPLAEAEFTLSLNANPQVQYKGVTDQKGELTFENIPYGQYTLKETKTPEGFTGAAVEDQVEISEEGQVLEYFFGNKSFFADLMIVKKDAEDGRPIALKGAKFKVYDVQERQFVTQYPASHLFLPVSEWSTDDRGKLGLEKPLKAGSYILVETKAPYGYLKDSKEEGRISFTHQGKTYSGIPFKLNEETCTVVEVPQKTYYQYEQSVLDQPAKGRITIEKTGEMTDGTSDQNTEYGTLTTFHFKEKPLAGAVFEIYAAEDITGASDGEKVRVYHRAGEKVAELITREDGKATTKDLYLGKYHVVEKSTAEGFVVDPQVYQIELRYQGEQVQAENNIECLKISNRRQQVRFKMKKNEAVLDRYQTGTDGQLELIKTQKPAEDCVFGLFTAEAISDGKGHQVPADRLVSLFTVKNGSAVTTESFPAGRYYYQELKTKDHLVLDAQKYPVEFHPEGQAPEIIVEANGGKPVVNEIFTKEFLFFKTDTRKGKPLANVVIGIFDDKYQLICRQTTDAKGGIRIPELAYGDYYCQELEVPKGYVRDPEFHPFKIRNDGQPIVASVENDLAMGTLSIEKQAEDPQRFDIKEGQTVFESKPLAGAEFVVRAREDIVTPEGTIRAVKGDIVSHLITDEQGKVTLENAWFRTGYKMAEERSLSFEKSPEEELASMTPQDLLELVKAGVDERFICWEPALFNGLYEVVEIKAPEGWVLDPSVYLADLSYKDADTPLVKIEPIRPFNQLTKGHVTLQKKDTLTAEAIPGTVISLYTQDHQKIYTAMTDDQGRLSIRDLPAGSYYFKEEQAAKGYLKGNQMIHFKIEKSGETLQCEMENQKLPNPSTGTEGGTWFLMGSVLVMLMIVFFAGLYHRKHSDER